MIDQTFLREFFNYNPATGLFTRRKKLPHSVMHGRPLGVYHSSGYLQTRIKNKSYYLHRLAWIYMHGEIPEGYVIDHINGVRNDNRIENLRVATRRENSRNNSLSRQKVNIFQHHSTGYWTGQITTIKGVRMSIGSYETKADAEFVYHKIKPLFSDV